MYPVRDDVFRLIPWAVYQEEVFQDHVHNHTGITTESENNVQLDNPVKSAPHIMDIKEILFLDQSRKFEHNDSSCFLSEPTRTPEPSSPDNPSQLHSFEPKMSPVFPLPSVPHVLEEEETDTRSASVITAMVDMQLSKVSFSLDFSLNFHSSKAQTILTQFCMILAKLSPSFFPIIVNK